MNKRRPQTKFYTKKGKNYLRRKGKVYQLKEVRPFYQELTNWIFLILIIIILALLINQIRITRSTTQDSGTTMQSSIQSSNSNENQTEQSSNNSGSKEESEIPYGTAGESDGLSLTINEVTESDSISAVGGFSTYTPEEGAKYALININLKNVGNEAVSTTNGWFKLVAGETVYSPSTVIVTGTDQNFITFESINPGLEQNGFLAFEVPQDLDVTTAILRFDGTGIFDDSLVFLLSE